MPNEYDAIVVGARCAGSPTAMLLARKGYRVLVVDRASFPSDTLSTHLIHAPGVAALQRWGLLVDAAGRAGAEVRERFTVVDVVVEDGTVVGIRGHGDGGEPVVERARVVIGADGRNSHVAKAVGAEEYNEKPR